MRFSRPERSGKPFKLHCAARLSVEANEKHLACWLQQRLRGFVLAEPIRFGSTCSLLRRPVCALRQTNSADRQGMNGATTLIMKAMAWITLTFQGDWVSSRLTALPLMCVYRLLIRRLHPLCVPLHFYFGIEFCI